MSEEIMNQEGLSPDTAEAVELPVESAEDVSLEESPEIAGSDEMIQDEAEAVDADVIADDLSAIEDAAEVTPDEASAEDAVAEEISEDAAADAAAEEVAEDAVAEEVAEDAASEEIAEEPPVDLTHLSWEDRVSYYLSRETIEGYIKAISLVDFHNPGDVQVAETWGLALNAHGEMAREIFKGASRMITSDPEAWSNILEAHAAALENTSDEGQAAIGEVIGWIQCLRTQDIEAGKDRLSNYDTPFNKNLLDTLAIVSTGNWRKVEQAVEGHVKAEISDENEAAIEIAHEVADYSLSAKALDRAVEMMRRTSRKFTDDISLKWRLAILSRDQKKWNAYVDVLSKELIAATEPIEEKVDIYNEMIRIYRDETKQEAMIVKTYEQLLAIDPGNEAALANIVEIYEKMRRWPDLIKVLDAQAEAADGERKVDLYLKIAKIYLEKVSRKVDAIKYFENVLSADPTHEESIEQLKALYTERRDWEKLIEIHKKELLRIDNVPDQIDLLKVMADLAKTKLRNNSVAIEIWNMVLERDAENAEALTALEGLYEGEKRWADLAGIMERQIALMPDTQSQFQALQKLGSLYSDKANDNVSAIATWRRVLEIDPTYAKGIDSLRKLLIEERDWDALEAYYTENDILPDLVKLFEQLSKTLKDDADKKAVLLRAAHVYEQSLGDSDKAMNTLEKILAIDAKDAVAAAELVGYYEPRGMNAELANMLEILHDSCELGEERSAYGLRLAKLFESKLSDDANAYKWYLNTVSEDIHYVQAFDGLERSSGKTGNAQVVVDLFRNQLQSEADSKFCREYQYRIGCLLLEYLNGSAEAQKIFEELLADDPEDVRALGALERILEREGRFDELLEVNNRRMELAKCPEDLAETLLSGARIQEHHLNNKDGAIESYERVCELLPEDARPLVELHRLYAETESYENLARVIEKQLELLGAPNAFSEVRTEAELNEEGIASVVYGARLVREEEGAYWVERAINNIDAEAAISYWYELGEVYRQHLSEYDASVNCYDNILLLDISHEGAIAAMEALLDNGVSTDVVCRALCKVYATQENYDALQKTLVTLAGAVSDNADKITYYVCASQINSEILENIDATLECLANAQACNPAGELVKMMLRDIAERTENWPRVVAILEGVYRDLPKEEDPMLATQYAIELSSLWETELDSREKAIEYGRQALALGGSRPEVLEHLETTFIRLESWNDVISVLRAQALLIEDDDEGLLNLNMHIAAIQEEYLDQKDEAINTLLEILEKHPDNTDAMVSLDRLYAACERWEEAVANYERRLELVEDTAERDVIECQMASILSDHLNEIDRAFDIYSSILAHDEQNELAIAGLERMIEANEGAIVEQISELLLPIYDATDNWERRCWTDEQLLRVVIEPDRRRDLLHEIAGLYEQRDENHEKAYEAYARSLKEDLLSQTTIDQLVNYAEVLDKWSDLVKVMEEATVDAEDVVAAKNIRCMAAQIYCEHLDDIDSAIETYKAIREQDPEDIEILNNLEVLYRTKEDWKALSEVIMAKSKLVSDPDERKELLFQAAQLNEDILGDVDAAIAIHTDILTEESGEPRALDCLERLYLGKEAWADLLNVYASKIEIAEDDDSRKALYAAMGELQETKLEDNVGAIENYQRILSIDPEDASALEALDRLYIATNDMTNLLEILERREAISEDDESRINFKFRQAECWYRNLDDCLRAIEVYNAVFELDPAHEASIASLEEIISVGGEPAIEAAKVLVPIYQGLERWEALVKVYEVLVAGSEDLDELIELLGTIGTVYEDYLNNPKAAFDAWYRALAHDVTRSSSREKVDALAETCDCWAELVEKLSAHQTELSSDTEAAIIVAKHMAQIYEEKLDEPEKAIEALRSVYELDSNDLEAIQGLDRLYEVLQKWQDLADILHTEIDIAEDDDARLNSYYRLGAVQEMYLENYEEAVNCYNEMHLIVPGQPEAIESLIRIFSAGHCCAAIAEILEAHYRGTEAWEELVALDLQYIDHIEEADDRYDKYIEIAEVLLNELNQIPEGLEIYGRALKERPGDDVCLNKIDELSEAIQDWTNNVVYYKNAIDNCQDDVIKQDLTLRMAQTYDMHLNDAENAEKCYLGVLGYDAEHLVSLEALDRIYAGQERWQELVDVIRREIPIVDSDETRITLYMRLGAVLNDMLGDGDGAIAAYNEILENLDPSYWDALASLEAIYHSREDWVSLDDIYDKEAAATNDDNQRVELWGKRAQLNSEILNKTDDAIDLWYQVIDMLGDNLPALQNLEVLFTRGEKWADVADVVERQVPLTADDIPLHLETYRKLGRVYRDKLEDNERSLDFWREAHQTDPTDLESLRSIEALDETLDYQDELAETLNKILQTNQLGFDDQIACAIKMAGVLDNLGRTEDTIATWRYVVGLDATRMDALNELERLYESESQWENVVNTLQAKIANLDDLEAKVELYLRIAEIWELQVGNIDSAAGAFQSILDLDPSRESAFASLVELYTNHERWQELLSAYLERSEVITDQQPRLELLLKGAKIAEENMQQPETAFAVLIQYAVPQNWKDETLSSEVQRLAELTNNWDTLVGTYEEMIENEVNPADNLALHNTVARWYFHHLNNNEASWQHFQFVLNEDPNNLPALAAMTEIFWRLGDWPNLVEYLNRRLELTTITDDRVSLFMELAKVLEEKVNDPEQAIECYSQAFKLNEQRLDVMKELARIYESRGQWNELVDILEREFPVLEEDEEKIAVRNKIGLIWESQLADYEKAVEAYVSVVQLDETNRTALTALERLNAALERWTDLLKVYEYQLAAFTEPEEQIAIYSKVSQVYETSLNDLENAITSMVQVTLIDPANIPAIIELERLYERAERWQDLIDILNVHINTLSNVNEHIELYRKLGTVYRDKMNDVYHAVESFQYLIGIDPSDKPAYYALADLYEASEDYIGAIDYLNHVINCLTDTAEAIQVHFRIGQLYDKHLQDDAAAEERYKICLDIDPSFMPAIDALSDMYERHEDWSNQVRILKQKVEFTRELDQKAEINCALGNVSLNKIGDPVNAYAYYNEALALQPDCVSAAWPLAEKHIVDKSWARALRLFEIVIKGIEFDGSNNASLYELNYKAGLCCQNLEQHQRALEFYRASYELNQDYAPTLLGMGEELLEANEYERAYNMFQSLLERFSGELTPEQVIQIYYDSAVAKKATNDLALARQLLERILEADGTQTKSLELIIDVCTEMGAWDAVVYYMSIHMERQIDKDIKFTELMKIARIYADKIGDTERQIQTYYQALEIDPNSRIVLNDLLNIYSSTGQWENAISILDRICENENDPQKIARLYYTIAVIYRDELNIDDLAIEYFNRTLDTDLNELRAFEAIDRILTASRDWETLEVNYTNMIKRIKDIPEFTDTLRQLWYGLGEIYRTRLNEWDKAIVAFQEASKLSPNELKYHHILSELYIRMPDHGRNAIEEIRTIIDLQGAAVTEEQERKNYRSLFYLYYQLGDLDKAWCISDITVAKGFAMQDEVDHHDGADDMLAAQLPRLNQDDVRNYIYHPALSLDLTKLFNYFLQGIRRVFCHKDKDEGIKKSRPLKPNNDSAFWRIYSNVVNSLGIANAPQVYDCEILSTGMRLANVDFLAFKIAPDMKVGRSMDELRFIIARNLFLYQNFYMAGINLGSNALKTLFMASAAFVNNMKPLDISQDRIFEALKDAPKAIQMDIRTKLDDIRHQDQKNVNISEWLRAVELTCDRVGLLYSANYGMAATLIKRDDLRISKLTAEERIAELTKFAMSDDYSKLRGRLNIKTYDDSDDLPQQ